MSVFAQYVPHTFAKGDWESHRQEVTDLALGSIARFCSNIPDAVLTVETLGPPDIEQRVGLTGGHIFQGECLPAYMWSNRLEYRTPMPGVFLCGAALTPAAASSPSTAGTRRWRSLALCRRRRNRRVARPAAILHPSGDRSGDSIARRLLRPFHACLERSPRRGSRRPNQRGEDTVVGKRVGLDGGRLFPVWGCRLLASGLRRTLFPECDRCCVSEGQARA